MENPRNPSNRVMARPTQDAIDTFVSITGSSEAVAVQKLEEHGGDLNEAVNAYFSEGDRTNAHASSHPVPQSDFMDIDDVIDVDSPVPAHPLLSAAQSLNPFSLINSTFGQRYFNGGTSEFSNRTPHVSHPREVREIPIEFKGENSRPVSSGLGPAIEEVTESIAEQGPAVHGTVIMDDDDEDLSSAPAERHANDLGDVYLGRHTGPNLTPLSDMSDYRNDIEEEMIRAAIEASKRDAEAAASQQFDVPNGSTGPKSDQKSPALEDDEIAHAVSLSLKTAEQEKVLRELGLHVGEQSSDSLGIKLEDVEEAPSANGRQGFVPSHDGASGKLKLEEGSTSIEEEAEDIDEQPLVRHRSRRIASENAETANITSSPPLSPHGNDHVNHQPNGGAFQSDEWGGISSEEHDEAVMLEAAMFGGIPEEGAYNFAYPQPRATHSNMNSNFYPRVPRPPSPSLTAQRLLREQQDDEYLASLQADREKELKAIEDAERRRLEEAAAREAALEEERLREEEARRKLMEEEEFERILAAKQASLPQEPSSSDESAVTLLIRMPDGSRCGRRFLKSDKLQSLFDYIDVGRVVKPGTYRLVRPYPRRAFTDEESVLSLSELGLTSKQEALFLELI